jgi:hypothetical protein
MTSDQEYQILAPHLGIPQESCESAGIERGSR